MAHEVHAAPVAPSRRRIAVAEAAGRDVEAGPFDRHEELVFVARDVVMTVDEEAAGKPVEVSRRDLFEAAARSDLALAFESAIGSTGTVARRGSISWELTVQGVTGHSSLIFSPLHLNPPAAPALFVLGLLLAAIYHRTGSLTPAVIAHGFNNGVAFLALRYVDSPAVTPG